MKYIHYGDTAVMTGDDIAEAVVAYAAVLGANGRTDTVHVPTVDHSGIISESTMLIGPASQVVLEQAPDDELEPDDPAFVERLRVAARSAGPLRPVFGDGVDPLDVDNSPAE